MALLNKIKNKLGINYRKKRWPGLINAYKQYLPVTKEMGIKIAKKVTEKGVVRLVKIAAGANI